MTKLEQLDDIPMTTRKKHSNMVPALTTAAASAWLNPRTSDPMYMMTNRMTPHTAEQMVYPSVLMAVVPAFKWRPMMNMLLSAKPMKLRYGGFVSGVCSTKAQGDRRLDSRSGPSDPASSTQCIGNIGNITIDR